MIFRRNFKVKKFNFDKDLHLDYQDPRMILE